MIALGLELSDREVLFVGQIVCYWATLEHEIFSQTLRTYDDTSASEPLPAAMNNLQFSSVFKLWQSRVVAVASGPRQKVLQEQVDEIEGLKDFRDALVHGIWEWDQSSQSRITTVRVRKREVIRTHFDAEALQDFCLRLSKLNFKIRYSGGIEEMAEQFGTEGIGYMSRRAAAMLTGQTVAKDWLSPPEADDS